MESKRKRKKQSKLIRVFRKIHRTTAIMLFVFFFFIAGTGILLGWKKHSNGKLLPETKKGTSTELTDWLPLDSLYRNACLILHDSVSPDLSTEIERIDVRKDMGSVKFVFKNHNYGIQLDGATGELLQVAKRRSDFIENLHDFSIMDKMFGTPGEFIKLIYTSIMGLGLLTFTVTGFWLWYGPKKLKKTI